MKKGQITIFVVIAVVLIALTGIVFYFLSSDSKFFGTSDEINPNSFLKKCIQEDLENTIEILSYQGGSLETPLSIKFQFKGEEPKNISYLCYTRNYYSPCISQQPVLINHLKSEIDKKINEKIESCWKDFILNLEKKDYGVNEKYSDYEINFFSEKIELNINAEISYSKFDETNIKKDFKLIYPTKFYELVKIAQEISSQEAKFCYFDWQGYMILYPNYEIKLTKIKEIKIYTIKEIRTNEIFRFAIRSCAIPPGLF